MDKDMTKDELMREIQALSFAKVETELYLDTHPDNLTALEYYKDTIAKLDEVMEKYQHKFGAIFAESVSGDGWNWVKQKWPWQISTDANSEVN